MKFTLLLTTVFNFLVLAASSASAADDASPVILDTNFSERVETAYPIVLADVADEESSVISADLAIDLPDYCSDDLDYDCYQKGVPRCCVRSRLTCPSNRRPGCDVVRSRIGAGEVCQVSIDVCERGYSCTNGRCAIPAISPGGYCRSGIDTCVNGYTCNAGRCGPAKSRIAPRSRIGNGEVCQASVDVCESGHSCVNGRCIIPAEVPTGNGQGGSDNGGGRGSGQWYTNWQYCVMDCPSTAGACCGGNAQSWDQTYDSAEACCGQSAFNGNHEGCVSRSFQCTRED